MITAIIVDDDIQYATILSEEIRKAAQFKQFGIEITITDNPLTCLESNQLFDIYFIDIVMPSMSGIDLAERLREKYINKEFIFVSSYMEYMRRSIYVKPRAFIRKEFLQSDLEETFSVLKSIFTKKDMEIVIKDNNRDVKIKPWDVTYMKSEAHYVNIYDEDGDAIVVRNSLKNLEKQLLAYRFHRIHSRYLVNINHIKNYSKHIISMKSGEKLPVSAPYARQISEIMMNYLMMDEL